MRTKTNKRKHGPKAQDPDELVELAIQKGLSTDRTQLDPHQVRRNLKPETEVRYNRELRLWVA